MELLYVWVESYGNISRQGFNFSPNYWFDFEKLQNDEYEESDIKQLKLFGNNIFNITAIVGKNGSGKSTIIKGIIKNCGIETDIYESKPSSFGYYYDKNIKELKELDNDYRENIQIIYYDNFLKSNLKKDTIDNLLNISNEYLKDKYNIKYTDEEIKKQIKFFKSEELERFKENLTNENRKWIKTPSKLKLTINSSFKTNDTDKISDVEKMLRSIVLSKYSIRDIENPKLNDCFYIFVELKFVREIFIMEDKKNLIKEIKCFEEIKKLRSEMWEQLKENIDKMNEPLNQEKVLSENKEKMLSEEISRKPNNFKLPKKGLNISKPDTIKDIVNEKISEWRKELNEIIASDKKVKIEYDKCLSELKKLNGIVLVDFDSVYLEISENYFDELNEFIKYSRESEMFNYSWEGLSTGEETLLSMYSRLYSIKEYIKGKYCLILLDEPENYLHPEWQRNLIKTFIEFINNVYKDLDTKFQIILTSHSPFVASDLPRENMIMLDVYDEKDEEVINGKQNIGNCKVVKNKDIKTFGANIFDLYTEAFFVESSFGEFAKGKIKEVVKDLTSNEKGEYGDLTKERIKEIEYIIDSIGEKLVSTKLEKLYEEYRNNKNSVEYKKEQLKMLQEKLGLSNEQMINIIKNGDLND